METQTGRLGDESKEGMNPALNEVLVRRIDKTLPLPEYKTDGAIGMDLCARLNDKPHNRLYLNPHQEALIPLNIVVKAPLGWASFIFPRSSLYKNYGLIVTNSVGVIDHDYCGDDDELLLAVKNISDRECRINHGDRLAQLVFLQPGIMKVLEVDSMDAPSRGGFGTTGRGV